MSYGLNDDEFWRKSPRQIVAILKGQGVREVREHNGRAWLAWHVAFLPRQKRPIPLRKLMMRPPGRRKAQSWQQIKSAVAGWVSHAGKPQLRKQ